MSEQFLIGEIVAIFEEDGLRIGKLRVSGAITRVALGVLPDVQIGDMVLVHAGVAVSRVARDKNRDTREA